MEEAVEFAKKNFGIEKFDFEDDVEMANWVNEGLTQINNRFKGKANIPKNFGWLTEKEIAGLGKDALACNLGFESRIGFDKNKFNNSIHSFKEMVENLFEPHYVDGNINGTYHLGADRITHGAILSLYDKLAKTPSQVSRFDALGGEYLLQDYAMSAEYFQKNGLSILKNSFLNDKEVVTILREHNLPVDKKYYESLSSENLTKKMYEIMELVGYDRIIGTSPMRSHSKFYILNHEMGHFLQDMSISRSEYLWGRLSASSTKRFLEDSVKQETAGKISWYAQTNPKEFVAEAFSTLCSGAKLPDDVMELYRFYKGPEIPNM